MQAARGKGFEELPTMQKERLGMIASNIGSLLGGYQIRWVAEGIAHTTS